MVLTILRYLAIAVVLTFIAAWLFLGGWQQVKSFVATVPNPVDILFGGSSDSYIVQLPWQVPVPQGPNISDYVEHYGGGSEDGTGASAEYAALEARAAALREYGTPSPYAGLVQLAATGASDYRPSHEYLRVRANPSNAGPVVISGWSVQSSLSGRRAYIPEAASPLVHGAVNRVAPVALAPGTDAILASGISPVGVSFRESICTGYLAQLQDFEPQLANACPVPYEEMQLSAGNLGRYGGECVDFVRRLPQCSFPMNLPANLSASCRIYVANTFTYNGCVSTFRSRSEFNLDTWRLYLGSGIELWANTHDVLRLLDVNGQVVDAVTY